jgi:uroporphyrinogen decarboxylase
LEALAPGHPWLVRQAELVRAVTALAPDTPCFYNIFSPSTSLRFLLGREKLLQWLTQSPQEVFGALTRMGRGLAALAESVVRAGGADGVYLSVQNPDPGRVTGETYARFIRPSDLAVLDSANAAGGRNILHICGYGGARNNLAAWADFPAQAFSWAVHVEKVSLGRGKALFGGRAVIGGFANVPGSLLESGSRAEIEAFTADLLAEAGRTGVILGADCTIPSTIDLERLEWVRLKAASP